MLRIDVLLNLGCRYENWSGNKQKAREITKKRRNQHKAQPNVVLSRQLALSAMKDTGAKCGSQHENQ